VTCDERVLVMKSEATHRPVVGSSDLLGLLLTGGMCRHAEFNRYLHARDDMGTKLPHLEGLYAGTVQNRMTGAGKNIN
jgi:hypothetical protein